MRVFGARFRFLIPLMALVQGGVLSGCHRAAKHKTTDSGSREGLPGNGQAQTIIPDLVPISTEQKSDISEVLTDELGKGGTEKLTGAGSSEMQLSAIENTLLWNAYRTGFAKRFVTLLKDEKSKNLCERSITNKGTQGTELAKCLLSILESESFASKDSVLQIVKEGLDRLEIMGQLSKSQLDDFYSKVTQASENIFSSISNAKNKETFTKEFGQSLVIFEREISLLSDQKPESQAPFLEDTFFSGSQFVLTTSFQQASIGTERMFNFQSRIVVLEIADSRLIIKQLAAGQFDSSNGIDIILGSYPILQKLEKKDGHVYYQVDFSRPENKQFLVPYLDSASSLLSLSADIVVPKLRHAANPYNEFLKSASYFTKENQNLILDQLILLNGSQSVFSDESLPLAAKLGKDAVRPTIHIVQGLFRYDAKQDDFAKKQAMTLADAQKTLSNLGVEGITDTKGATYFTADPFLSSQGGRPRQLQIQARKMNLEKPLVFVVSNNTPAAAFPAILSAVKAYERVLLPRVPEGIKAEPFSVVTQKEFESKNSLEGLKLGSDTAIAADPRINMILWDEGMDLGAAWATASAHPRTGEVISADVMLSGTMWAKIGCIAYFNNKWGLDNERPTKGRPAAKVPSAITKTLWELRCAQVLLDLGFYSDTLYPQDDVITGQILDFPTTPDAEKLLLEATQSGDNMQTEALAKKWIPGFENFEANRRQKHQESGWLQTALKKIQSPFGISSPNVNDFLQKISKFSKRMPSADLKEISEGDRQKFGHLHLKDGTLLNTHLDCDRLQGAEDALLALSPALLPKQESLLLNSPKEGALALLKTVTLHELGHTFGLRHNFIASGRNSALTDSGGISVSTGTDSIMDYNDYAIEMELGAMKDITTGSVETNTAEFGAYDIAALGSLYNLNLGSFAVSANDKIKFCTDNDVSLLGECQRFDFGNDYTDFLLLRSNILLETLRNSSVFDSILPGQENAVSRVLGAYLQASLGLTIRYAATHSVILDTNDLTAQKTLAKMAAKAFYAESDAQGFIKAFTDTVGTKPLGVLGQLQLKADNFSDKDLGPIIANIINEENTTKLIAAAKNVREIAENDRRFFGHIKDVKISDAVYPFASDLYNFWGRKVFVPTGEPLDFQTLIDGARIPGAQITRGGVPLILSLPAPFLNYSQISVVLPNVAMDAKDGTSINSFAIFKGTNSLSDIILNLSAIALLDGGFPGSPSHKLIKSYSEALNKLITQNCEPGSLEFCYKINKEALDGVLVLSSVVKDLETVSSSSNVSF